MNKNILHYLPISIAVSLALLTVSCNLVRNVQTQSGGTVKGVVYGDRNGNGIIDTDEGPLEGVTVSIGGCGSPQSQSTQANGAFSFTGLPPGSCQVTVAKPDWAFTRSSTGAIYPILAASEAGVVSTLSIDLSPVSALTPTPTATPEFTPTPSFTPTNAGTDTPTEAMVRSPTKTANCRYGPSLDYLSVGQLSPNQWVPIDATVADQSWWRIQNPTKPGFYCWVGSSITETAGDLSLVLVVGPPGGIAISAYAYANPTVHGNCSGSNTNTFTGTISTNGPGQISYHWEIDNSAGVVLTTTGGGKLIYHTAGKQSVAQGSYTGGCGSYVVRLIVDSPNTIVATAAYEVEP